MSSAARSVAWWISTLGHPFVMVAVLVTAVSRRIAPGADAPGGLLVVVVLAVLPVALLMARQVRGGRWSNADASRPSERPLLFAVALGAIGALLVWLRLSDPESFLIRGSLGVAGLLIAAAVLTRWVKVSLHLAFAGLAGTSLVLLGSIAGYAIAAAVPLLAWSRFALSRHTPGELAAGLALGVAIGFALVR